MGSRRSIPGRLAVSVVAIAAVWMPFAAGAQQQGAAVVAALSGSATVSRAGASRSLLFRDSLFDGDRISVAEKSVLRVLFGCTAIVTARELSGFTITETGSRAGLRLSSGRLGLAVARQLMTPHEALQISTPNALASVEGSSVVVDVQGAEAGAALVSVFSVLSGPVEIAAGGAAVRVGSHQRLRVRDSTPGLVEGLTDAEVGILAADLKGGARQHSAPSLEFNEMLKARERNRAAGLAFGRIEAPAGSSVGRTPHVQDIRASDGAGVTPGRCASRVPGATGIVKESDTGKPGP